MVKVKEKSLEERTEEERAERLLQIAAQIIGKENAGRTGTIIGMYGSKILIRARINLMHVYDSDYFDIALKLAGVYEEVIGEEFTLKKDYD